MPLDIQQFSAHVQTAVVALDLAGLARKRVKEGVRWLDSNAPCDWRLQMISIYDGKVSSHVRLGRNDENPLALALRRLDAFKGPDGRVTWGTVTNPPLMSNFEAQERGFKENHYHGPDNVYIDEDIDGKFLDEAWAEALGEYRWDAQPVRAYPKAVEEASMLWRAARSLAAA